MSTPPLVVHIDALAQRVGEELVCSDWEPIEQSRIDAFAATTGDTQWIHTDPERARRESPFGTTVAHGYLTLSLLPALLGRSLHIEGIALAMNYGLDRVRFPAPVPVGSRVRARVKLESLTPVEGGLQAHFLATIEREGSDRPVCVAQLLARYLRPNAATN